MSAYQDILYASRPRSTRPKMPLSTRAKLFAPFSALRGFEISILTQEQDRVLSPRPILDQQRMEELDRAIRGLCAGDEVQLSWFVPVKKIGELELGEFRTATGRVIRIDLENRVIDLAGVTVGMGDVFVVVGGIT